MMQMAKKAARAAFSSSTVFCCDLAALEETTKLLVELVNTTSRINNLLFAGIERMATGANFNMEVVFGHRGLGYEAVAARASHCNVFISRMNVGSHYRSFTNRAQGFCLYRLTKPWIIH